MVQVWLNGRTGNPCIEAIVLPPEHSVKAHSESAQLIQIGDMLVPGQASAADVADLLMEVPVPPREWGSFKRVRPEVRAAIIEEVVGAICMELDSD
jgi:hypothetical protein